MNVASFVYGGHLRFPERPAIMQGDKIWSYKDLHDRATRIADGLLNFGIQPGDRVGLILPNVPGFVAAYYGVLRIRGIVVSISTALVDHEIQRIITDSETRVVITSRDVDFDGSLRGLFGPERVLYIDADASADWIASNAHPTQPLRVPLQSPAAILYTSGTTGDPKGVILSHRNIIFNALSKIRYCRTRASDRLLVSVPLFHCFGQNAVMNHGLAAGATLILIREFRHETVWSMLGSAECPTMLLGVPTQFTLLLRSPRRRSHLGSVRYCFSAAAAMSKDTALEWSQSFGININEGYGLTETSPFASYNHERCYKLGSIGTPIAGVEMKIEPHFSGEGYSHGSGEILVRGPNVMLGYWRRPHETAEVIRDGWLRTGDIGSRNSDGYFYLSDRIKDMINVGGLKVYSAEVESVLLTHPSVTDAAVFGKPDRLLGEVVSAAVVLRYPNAARKEELLRYCSSRLANFKVPSHLQFVSKLPRNPTGKVLKRVLKEATSNVPA